MAVDGDTSTSWFGDGSLGAPGGSVFTWEHPDALDIDRVTVVGNGANADSTLRTSTGFESVTVEILDNGTVTYSETFGLPGTPDPTINARPDARGNTVRLTFVMPYSDSTSVRMPRCALKSINRPTTASIARQSSARRGSSGPSRCKL